MSTCCGLCAMHVCGHMSVQDVVSGCYRIGRLSIKKKCTISKASLLLCSCPWKWLWEVNGGNFLEFARTSYLWQKISNIVPRNGWITYFLP